VLYKPKLLFLIVKIILNQVMMFCRYPTEELYIIEFLLCVVYVAITCRFIILLHFVEYVPTAVGYIKNDNFG
jgi:hypothetical protein